MFLSVLSTHFSQSRLARVRMSSKKGPKYLYVQEHKLCYYSLLSLWRALRKENSKQSEKHFFRQRCEKTARKTNDFSILIGCLHHTIIWFSLFIGLFQRNNTFQPAKFSILAGKMHYSQLRLCFSCLQLYADEAIWVNTMVNDTLASFMCQNRCNTPSLANWYCTSASLQLYNWAA